MIVVDDVVLSDDVADRHFVCDLTLCRGACCVEGDRGAPLDDDERRILAEVREKVEPYLTKAGQQTLDASGPHVCDQDGVSRTPLIDDTMCAYTIPCGDGIMKCAIEKAYLDGAISFRKPISCHLYPIRISGDGKRATLVNYHEWDICADACVLGRSLGVPVYKFVKDALVRRFGERWYSKLAAIARRRSADQAKV